ncbi:hypothetical protein [Candidatus Enterococcus clewellii]|uniref:Sigma factor regulator C-terminal domain-containing protein n=1 Tax=Candidatus Enterococcus clewellii TaxID=1834193 RepID=A0A242KC45_9ENTE|nr:hypothetical protein [Enterococcus sp. 9E7_DIV0242]OTP18536.1 hypothetical protein A5888_000350 [Enterococcus sp. 9E7_DIV0242]
MKESEEFKQLLERYRWGQVTEEEKAYVEEELKKAEAIQEYLFETEEFSGITEQTPVFEESSTQAVRKIVRKKWLKHGFLTGLIILFVLLGGWSFGRPLLNKMYFDPTKGRTEKTYSDYELYKKIENGLTVTGHTLEDIQVEQTGIGSYILRYNYYDALKNETSVHSTVLKRGKIEAQPISGTLEQPWLSYNMVSTEEMFGNQHNQLIDELKEKVELLPKTAVMKINLHFDYYHQMDLKAIKELVLDHKLDRLLAVGITSSNFDSVGISSFGIRFKDSYVGYGNENLAMKRGQIEKLNKEYPRLIQNGAVTINSDPEKLEQYYFSMLDYLLDNEKLGEEIERTFNPEIFTTSSTEIKEELKPFLEVKSFNQQLKDARSYAKENGISATQATLLVSPEEFKALTEDERVPLIGVVGVELLDSRMW